MVPYWVAIIVSVIILGIFGVCLIGTDIAKKEIERVEEKVGKKVFLIKALQIDIEMLAKDEADADTKEALNKLAQKIRFSDPMSVDEIAELEVQITEKVGELLSFTVKNK